MEAAPSPSEVFTKSFSSLLGLKKGIFFAGTSTFSPVLGVAPHSAATLPSAKAAKAADLNFFPFLQCADDALENSLDNRLGLFAREFGYPQNLFNEVSLGQCGLLGHRP